MRARVIVAVVAVLGAGALGWSLTRDAEHPARSEPAADAPTTGARPTLAVPAAGEPATRPDPVKEGDDSILVDGMRIHFSGHVQSGEAMGEHDVVGRVLLPGGAPAVGALVRPWHGFGAPPVTTDSSGAFRLAIRWAQAVEVRATLMRPDGEYSADGVAPADRAPLTITLAAGIGSTHVRVNVLDGDGVPVPMAGATFHTEHSVSAVKVADGRAEFDLEGDASHETGYVLVASPAAADGTPMPWGSGRVDGAKGGGTYEIRLPPEASISGRVVDPDGHGLAGVPVAAERDDAGLHSGPRSLSGMSWSDGASVRTDDAGAFRIGRLGEGLHWLAAKPPENFREALPVKALAGASEVLLTLRTGTAPTITVLDPEGNPLKGAAVWAVTKQEYDFGIGRDRGYGDAATAEDGTIRLAHLDAAATYVLRIFGPEPQAADWAFTTESKAPLRVVAKRVQSPSVRRFANFEQAGWTPADTTVRLESGFVVKGFVRDAAGAPVAHASLRCMEADGRTSDADSKDDGSFTFEGLRSGSVELRAALDYRALYSLDAGDRVVRAVAAGTEDVALVLDPGAPLLVRVENWSERAGRFVGATVFPEGEERPFHAKQFGAHVEDDGSASFRGLERGVRYVLWIDPDPEGRSLYATGLVPGPSIQILRLLPGKTIRGRLSVPEGFGPASVGAFGHGIRVAGSVDAEGRYEILGLPEGSWTVGAVARKDEVHVADVATVAAGGVADLELKPIERPKAPK